MNHFAVLVRQVQKLEPPKSTAGRALPDYLSTAGHGHFAGPKDHNKIDLPAKAYLVEAKDTKAAERLVTRYLKKNGLDVEVIKAVQTETLPVEIVKTLIP